MILPFFFYPDESVDNWDEYNTLFESNLENRPSMYLEWQRDNDSLMLSNVESCIGSAPVIDQIGLAECSTMIEAPLSGAPHLSITINCGVSESISNDDIASTPDLSSAWSCSSPPPDSGSSESDGDSVSSTIFCAVCGHVPKRPRDLKRHNLTHEKPKHECPYCGNLFKRKDSLARHMRKSCAHSPNYGTWTTPFILYKQLAGRVVYIYIYSLSSTYAYSLSCFCSSFLLSFSLRFFDHISLHLYVYISCSFICSYIPFMIYQIPFL